MIKSQSQSMILTFCNLTQDPKIPIYTWVLNSTPKEVKKQEHDDEHLPQAHNLVGAYESVRIDHGKILLATHLLDHEVPPDEMNREMQQATQHLTIEQLLKEANSILQDSKKRDHIFFEDVGAVMLLQIVKKLAISKCPYEVSFVITSDLKTLQQTATIYGVKTKTTSEPKLNQVPSWMHQVCDRLLSSYQVYHMLVATLAHSVMTHDSSEDLLYFEDSPNVTDFLKRWYSEPISMGQPVSRTHQYLVDLFTYLIPLKENRPEMKKAIDAVVPNRGLLIRE